MKTSIKSFAAAAALLFLTHSCVAPSQPESACARLRLSLSGATTRTAAGPFDTGRYILGIKNASGLTVHRDYWENSPDEFELDAGTYTVSAESAPFTAPAYDSPQYGDSRQVTLAEGESAEVELVATLNNAGLRLQVSEAFRALYREATIFLQNREGTLAYGMEEERTAYFVPGSVYVLMNHQGESKLVYTATLQRGSVTTLRLGVAEKTVRVEPVCIASLGLAVDTSSVRKEIDFAWNGESSGGEEPAPLLPSEAVDVNVARTMAGSRGIWVYGYVAGGDLTSKSCSFEAPFSSRTNLLLAPSASCRDRSACMSVQLPAGDIRNALNLVDNPALLGKKIYLCGDVKEAYYGLPGLQNLTDYRK